MGLFLDNNEIHISYKLFSGNTYDCMTYRQNLSRSKHDYGLDKIVVMVSPFFKDTSLFFILFAAKLKSCLI